MYTLFFSVLGDAPVEGVREKLLEERNVGACFRRGDAERARQRQPEHRKTVGHANAQMNAERGRRHQPAIEPGFGNDAFPVQESQSRTGKSTCTCDGRHMRLPHISGRCRAPSLGVASTKAHLNSTNWARSR